MTAIDIDPAADSLSYWHANVEPMVPTSSLPATAEAVVIGGGMLGCWTSYWLARAGVNVVLLEATAIGWGATGRNGGFLVGGTAVSFARLSELVGAIAARSLHQITMDGQQLAFDTVAEESIDCGLRRVGTLSLALNEQEFADPGADTTLLHDDVAALQRLDRQHMGDLVSTTLGDQIVGGWFAPGDGTLHSTRYLTGVARAAERHGARLVRAKVRTMTAAGDGVRIETDAGEITAGHVIVALNAWSDTLIPETAGSIVPVRGQILAYQPTEPVFSCAVGADLTPTGEYWQQVADGSIVIGGCRAEAPQADVGVRELVPTTQLTDRIERILPDLFPDLGDLQVARRWAGPMAFTADRLPIVDRVPGLDNAWFGGGFNGHGMTFGPRLGQLLAETVTTGAMPDVVAPLSLNRASLQTTI